MLRMLFIMFYLMLVAAFSGSLLASEAKTIEWTDLIPESEQQLMANLPEVQHDTNQSIFDRDYTGDDPAAMQWQEILKSAKVRTELNNSKVRIPGFIVPLEFDDKQNITHFFLVPYFGACIHVPPPPPNQIIYVSGARNLKADMIYSPFWISGTLITETMSHDLGQSAYSIKADSVEEYSY